MRKDLTLIVTILLTSIAISYGLANYLLINSLFVAVVLIGLYFSGLWLPEGKISTKTHALWLGISIGFFGAVLFFLPSVFAA